MGMAGYDDVDTPCDGIDIQALEVMKDVDCLVREANNFGFGILRGPSARIHVPTDRGDGRNPPQYRNDIRFADVTGMYDVIDTGKSALRLRP
jgi:hypothetical protein